MASKAAQSAVERILNDLTDRKGLRQAWDEIDEATQIEIRKIWRQCIDEEISRFFPI